MRNKNLFESKMDRIDGKLQTLKVMITRQTTVQDLQRTIGEIEELSQDMRDMLERE
jgi:hypothetical protein